MLVIGGNEPIHFYVDSQPAIRAVTGIECESKTVLQCKKTIEQLLQTPRSVTFHWVRAHVGHELNEKADRAAKFGTMSRWTYEVPIPWCQIKAKLRAETYTNWTTRWQGEITCRQTRLILPKPSSEMSKFLLNLTRADISRMVQFITGHNYLRYCYITHRCLCRHSLPNTLNGLPPYREK